MQLEEFAKQLGLIIYDTELVKENDNYIYRIYLMKDLAENKSVSLDDCENFSRLISPILDITPPTSEKYFLEVSSPGLERKLSKLEHFQLSINELLKIKTKTKEQIISKLIAVNENEIVLENQTLNFDDIKSARTYIEW